MKRLEIEPENHPCSFCGVPRPQRHMIVTSVARTRWICEVCIRDCGEILGEELAAVLRPDDPSPFHLTAVEDPEFLEELAHIMRDIATERAARGPSFLVEAGRAAALEPLVRAHRPVACCSFCSRPETEVARLISGSKVYICEACVLAAAYVHDRFKLRRQYASLYDDLILHLFRHDPVGLDFETNTDEYAPEVRAILLRLESCSSVGDVASLLHEVFIQYFDAKLAGPRSIYEHIAPGVWDLLQIHAKPRF